MEEKLPFENREEVVIVKKKAVTSPDYGSEPDKRSVEQLINYGVVNINKPAGPTSHQISAYVKNILGIDKAGHSGTLDPNVTGVLPVALAKGTRVVQALLNAGKEYVCLMRLHQDVEEKKIIEAFKKFTGSIKQLPPVKSAVKRQVRRRNIYYINIIEILHHEEIKKKEILFRIGCEAGTYIRKICHDLGQELEVGAHMQQLIRTKAGPFKDNDWVSLQDLKDAYVFWKDENNETEIRKCIKPFERAVDHLPKIWVLDNAVDTLCHGASLSVPGVSKFNEFSQGQSVAIMTLKSELIGLGEAKMGSLKLLNEERGIVVTKTKIFMDRGIYTKK
ncbi:MAG: RNA-guided pseudouridylation complex pseudouridine synthase subunit Cbf5 [Candidatus Nanoarchaeia archaeon]|nr:RNA-guided pseudouridylation complex pseudouridine synthase subunit Cbf5 [Candidatus Nanoarchaeia archaeon]